MPFPISRDALQRVIAGSLARQIVPLLSDPHQLKLVESCIDLSIRDEIVRGSPAGAYQGEMNDAIAADMRTLAANESTAELRQAAEQRLLVFIGEESARYREYERQVKQASAQLLQTQGEVFPVPTEAAITAALRARFPGDPKVRADAVKNVAGGQSKQTVLFNKVAGDGKVEALVMRRDHPNSFVATTVVNEFPILSALSREGYIVPEPLWLETDSAHIPGAFLVMRMVSGSTAGNSFAVRPDLADRALALLADALGRLHALPLAKLDIPGFSASAFNESTLLATIDYWYQRYRADADRPEPLLEIGYAWLRGNVRVGLQAPVLVHSELGFHNLMADDQKFTAVLDWELTHVGSPAEDLSYVKDYVEWVGSFDTFLDLYQKAGGAKPDPAALHYYELFKLIRNGGIYLSAVQSFNRGLNDNPVLPSICIELYSGYVGRIEKLLQQVMGRLD